MVNTLLDRNTQEDQERTLHNSMINERYKNLLGVVEEQFQEAPTVNAVQTYAPVEEVSTVETTYTAPATEQVPHVTEYTPTGVAASLFTTETLDRIAPPQQVESTFAPTVIMPQERVMVAPKIEKEATYSLTPMAKLVMAVFTAVVVMMLALIGVNSYTIQRKSIRLKNLEEKKQELMERSEEVQRYIDELQTEESIIERATQAGLLN
jgi:cell division protein FtsL